MNVVVAADHNFRLQAAILLLSLRATDPDADVHLLVLHPDLDPATRGALQALAGPWHIEFRSVDEAALRAIRLPGRLRPSTLFRLSIAELAPPDWEHALYLDADAVVRRSLGPLWEQRYEMRVVGAVQDAGSPFFGSPKGPPYRELDVSPQMPYFNAGVLLIDLAAWREADVATRSLRLLHEHALPHADQCALNAVLRGAFTPLDARWNVMSHLYLDHNHLVAREGSDVLDAVRAEAAIVHFCTSPLGRPWIPGCEHPEQGLWSAYREAVRAALPAEQWMLLAPSAPAREGRLMAASRALGGRMRGLGRRWADAPHPSRSRA